MGRSYTPKYIVVIVDQNGKHDAVWNVNSRSNVTGYGRPTYKNLEKYLHAYAKSLEIGGVNVRISEELGYIPYPVKAWIFDQTTGEIKVSWEAAKFQVW